MPSTKIKNHPRLKSRFWQASFLFKFRVWWSSGRLEVILQNWSRSQIHVSPRVSLFRLLDFATGPRILSQAQAQTITGCEEVIVHRPRCLSLYLHIQGPNRLNAFRWTLHAYCTASQPVQKRKLLHCRALTHEKRRSLSHFNDKEYWLYHVLYCITFRITENELSTREIKEILPLSSFTINIAGRGGRTLLVNRTWSDSGFLIFVWHSLATVQDEDSLPCCSHNLQSDSMITFIVCYAVCRFALVKNCLLDCTQTR